MSQDNENDESELRPLVRPDEFAEVMSKAYEREGTPVDRVGAERSWKRLEQQTGMKAKRIGTNSGGPQKNVIALAAVFLAVLAVWQWKLNHPTSDGIKSAGEIPQMVDLVLYSGETLITNEVRDVITGGDLSLEVEVPPGEEVWIISRAKGQPGTEVLAKLHHVDSSDGLVRWMIEPEPAGTIRYCAVRVVPSQQSEEIMLERIARSWEVLQASGCITLEN